MLPNFLIIGAMKAGTSSLHGYLREHPQIFMSDPKEIHYFAEELNWREGPDWYEAHFAEANGFDRVGEASTSYAKYPEHRGVPRRIAEALPDAKLIYLVRHPVERIRSHYLHEHWKGRVKAPLEKAVIGDPRYVQFSRYAYQIDQYLEWFPRDKILVVVSEELRRDRKGTLARALDFLGLDSSWNDPVLEQEFHVTSQKRKIRSTFDRLRELPGYDFVVSRLPEGVKDTTFRLRSKGMEVARGDMPDHVRDHLTHLLKDDVRRLRTFMSNGFDGWGIA